MKSSISEKIIKILVISAVLTLALLASETPFQTAISQSVTQGEQSTYWWPMFHHDAAFTGYSESLAPNAPNMLWNYTLSGGVMCASPAVADGRLFIQSEDNVVYCLNATSGAFLWKHVSEGTIEFAEGQYHPNRASAAVADGKVFVGSIDDFVYCLNSTNGEVIWRYKTGDDLFSFVTVAEGKVFTGSADFYLYCFNSETGALVWRYFTGDWPFNPAVAYGKVFAGSHDRFFALDVNSGDVVWEYTAESVISDSPCVAVGRVFFADGGSPQGFVGSRVHCLDANSGTMLWSADAPPAVFSSPAFAYGRIFVGSWDRSILCLNPDDGAVIWRYETGDSVASSPAVADGKLYVGSNDGFVYCLNATMGTPIWGYKVGNEVKSSPAIADGRLYVVSREGIVYCFGASGQQPPPFTLPSYEFYLVLAAAVIAIVLVAAYLYVRLRDRRT